MEASVIIPTYNNRNVLEKCLDHLSLQKDIDFEVIVIDDGSQDSTQAFLQDIKSNNLPFVLNILKQENQGSGIARNAGLKKATGDIIIFLDADMLVSQFWLLEHITFHKKFVNLGDMGVGFITWAPCFAQDRFRKWLENIGLMPCFKGLSNYDQTDFWHFYTGNISVKSQFIQSHHFDNGFYSYGWEDTMLGYKLIKEKQGSLYYLQEAKAFHYSNHTKKDIFPHRMNKIGQSAVYFSSKYPQAGLLPHKLKLYIFMFLSQKNVLLFLKGIKKEWWWYALSKKYFLEGMEESQKSCLKTF
jgi:glycosyltransferase involved in cell wall biosynthesis